MSSEANGDISPSSTGYQLQTRPTWLLYATLVSFGVALGSTTFYLLLGKPYTDVLKTTAARHNATIQVWSDKYQTLLEERDACWKEHESSSLEASTLQGQLMAQADWYPRHVQVVKQYEETLDELEAMDEQTVHMKRRIDELLQQVAQVQEQSDQMKASLQGREQTNEQQQQEIREQQARLEELHQSRSQLQEELQAAHDDRSSLHQQLVDRQRELEGAVQNHQALEQNQRQMREQQAQLEELRQMRSQLQAELQAARDDRASLDQQLVDRQRELQGNEMQVRHWQGHYESCNLSQRAYMDQVRRRQGVLCKEEFGKGPYYIQFTVKRRESENSSTFVVEVAARKHLPHAVYNFLSLVGYQLYNGTIMKRTTEHGGALLLDPTTTTKDDQQWQQTYRALGFGGDGEHEKSGLQTLQFQEEDPDGLFACKAHSVGFVGLGPQLQFYVREGDQTGDHGGPCLGTVVRGQEVVDKVFDLVQNDGVGVEITTVELLML